jgi:hypothetical protein
MSARGQQKLTDWETRHLPDSPEAFRQWRQLIVAHEVKGAKVHDTRLAVIMRVQGIRDILKFSCGRLSSLRQRDSAGSVVVFVVTPRLYAAAPCGRGSVGVRVGPGASGDWACPTS